jgi:hypothetical protein
VQQVHLVWAITSTCLKISGHGSITSHTCTSLPKIRFDYVFISFSNLAMLSNYYSLTLIILSTIIGTVSLKLEFYHKLNRKLNCCFNVFKKKHKFCRWDMCLMHERIKDKWFFVKFAMYKLVLKQIPPNFSYNVC